MYGITHIFVPVECSAVGAFAAVYAVQNRAIVAKKV